MLTFCLVKDPVGEPSVVRSTPPNYLPPHCLGIGHKRRTDVLEGKVDCGAAGSSHAQGATYFMTLDSVATCQIFSLVSFQLESVLPIPQRSWHYLEER